VCPQPLDQLAQARPLDPGGTLVGVVEQVAPGAIVEDLRVPAVQGERARLVAQVLLEVGDECIQREAPVGVALHLLEDLGVVPQDGQDHAARARHAGRTIARRGGQRAADGGVPPVRHERPEPVLRIQTWQTVRPHLLIEVSNGGCGADTVPVVAQAGREVGAVHLGGDEREDALDEARGDQLRPPRAHQADQALDEGRVRGAGGREGGRGQLDAERQAALLAQVEERLVAARDDHGHVLLRESGERQVAVEYRVQRETGHATPTAG